MKRLFLILATAAIAAVFLGMGALWIYAGSYGIHVVLGTAAPIGRLLGPEDDEARAGAFVASANKCRDS
jgi:hypothetical protein